MQAREKDDRRDWVIVILIILIGFMCILCAGAWAVRLTPSWKLDSNMESRLNPNSDFLTGRPSDLIAPVNASILTLPSWYDTFLTPGAQFNTSTPVPVITRTPVVPSPTVTQTKISTLPPTPTYTITPLIFIPTNTFTSKPPTPTTKPSGPTADLRIVVTDNSPTYTIGGTITYAITVYNTTGPSSVNGATVVDNFPPALSNITWTCAGSGGATCTANGAGNINDSINLPVGSSVTYTVNANISPAATGNLTNTATVTLPGGITDPVPGNNTASDTDTPSGNVDLQITKGDGVAFYTPGNSVTYTIVVTNPTGPANAAGATVTDTFPAQAKSIAWSCVAAGGASCTANGTGNINDIVNVPVGGSVTYTAVVTTSSATSGDMINEALVTAAAGYTDTNPGNNTASDTDTPVFSADLGITKTDNATDYEAGKTTTYTIIVSNNGPGDVIGATVSDNIPAQITSWTWVCTLQNGGAAGCDGITGSSVNFTDMVDLPSGASIEYTVMANISGTAAGALANTASVSVPAGIIDSIPGNDFATDTDQIIVASSLPYGDIGTTRDGFPEFILPNRQVDIKFNTPLVVGGHAGYDLVYYEWPQGVNPGVWMDAVILQLGDGRNWYTIFNWGSNPSADTNTNIPVPLTIVPPNTDCAGEPDNCIIDATLLFNATGVAIQLDGVVPDGVYPYIRIISPPTAPAGPDNGDGVEVDAIVILP